MRCPSCVIHILTTQLKWKKKKQKPNLQYALVHVLKCISSPSAITEYFYANNILRCSFLIQQQGTGYWQHGWWDDHINDDDNEILYTYHNQTHVRGCCPFSFLFRQKCLFLHMTTPGHMPWSLEQVETRASNTVMSSGFPPTKEMYWSNM
jgi:hypothetical protein